ncbi:MAG: hypothetical protein KF687_07685 [Cyclobacteriaceae bacterium]|nr:hypothetical protein [Cyclobacteriaceae bacterium]
MKLTREQVAVIRQKVEKSKITIDSLKDDVLDHLCCVVEIMMDRGKNFENAVSDAINDLAPNGLDEIQRETVFLLNSKKIFFMKRLTYTIGLLSSMSFMLGWSFGMLHWLGARELSIFGFLGFVFLYVPLLAFDRYKSNIRWLLSDKLKFILGAVSGLILAVAILFKIMHLQGADQLLILGTGFFTFGFLPFLFFTMYKKSIS